MKYTIQYILIIVLLPFTLYSQPVVQAGKVIQCTAPIFSWFMPHNHVLQELQHDKRIVNIKQYHDSEASVVALQNDKRLGGVLTINTARDIIMCSDTSGQEYQFFSLGKNAMLIGVVVIQKFQTEAECSHQMEQLTKQIKKLFKKKSDTIFENSVAYEMRCTKEKAIQKVTLVKTPDNKIQVRYFIIPAGK